MADSTRRVLIADYLSRGWALTRLHGLTPDGHCTCGDRSAKHARQAGKHPVDKAWQNSPITQLERAMAELGTDDGSVNIGLVTGDFSKVWVLDIDPDHGGDEALAELVQAHAFPDGSGGWPGTYAVTTGSGGRHLYWTMPTDFEVTNSRGRLPVGLDVRGNGGQVVVPPSVSGRGAYQVARDIMPEPAPEWLLALIRPVARQPSAVEVVRSEPEAVASPEGYLGPFGEGDRGRAYTMRAVIEVCAELAEAPEGMRNQTAYRVACRLIELSNAGWSGLSVEAAYGAYSDAARRADQTGEHPFDESEAAACWASAARHIGDKAADLPGAAYRGEAFPFVGTPPAVSSVSTSTIADPVDRFPPFPADADQGVDLIAVIEPAPRETVAEPTSAGAAGAASTGWEPVDLSGVLDGTAERVLPDLGTRQDGQAMLYRGKEHSIASEPECGKTWWMALQVVHVLMTGGRVVWVDFEDDALTVVGQRMLALGILPQRLSRAADRFRFAAPDGPYGAGQLGELLRFDDGAWADLVVYDGVTEGMGLFGLNPLGQEDAVKWRRWMIKPALAVGAATISSDHVVKDADARGRYAIGAQHKLAGLTGVAFLMEQVQPFGRGLKGRSRVLVAKDRNGGLRQHGTPSGAGLTHIGDLVGDATQGEMSALVFWPPMPDEPADQVVSERTLKLAGLALDALAAAGRPLTSRDILARTRGKTAHLIEALGYLEDMGCVQVEVGQRGTRLHHFVKRLDAQPVDNSVDNLLDHDLD